VQHTYLILSDGTFFEGESIGYPPPDIERLCSSRIEDAPCGEIVFNTTMGAYHEILTDPSYAGQVIVMTSVHIGNYGCDRTWNESCSDTAACRAFIMRDAYDGLLPPDRISLSDILAEWNVCGLSGVDTRALTLHIRDFGAMYAVVVRCEPTEIQRAVDWITTCPPFGQLDFIPSVTAQSVTSYKPAQTANKRFALIDFGVKRSIVNSLLARNVETVVIPATMDFSSYILQDGTFDAVLLSNGPGDPALLTPQIDQIKRLVGTVPLFGICLGHQLIAHALGAKTTKMKFGHHGGNQPVVEHTTGSVFVTAQNHGYCVVPESLPSHVTVWMTNADDGTNEGLFSDDSRVASVQFHPEASPGPRDSQFVFDAFINIAEGKSIGGLSSCR